MIRTHFQSSFPVQTLSTAQFVWAREDSWESDEISYFAQSMTGNGSNATTPFFATGGTRKRKFPTRLGRWVLRDAGADRICCLAAELWELSGSFSQLHLMLASSGASQAVGFDVDKSVNFFTTAIAIGSKADIIRVISYDTTAQQIAQKMITPFSEEAVQVKRIISPISVEWASLTGTNPFLKLDCAVIDAHSWMRDPASEDSRGSLEYLEKRMQPKPNLNRPRSQKGFRSIFSGYTRRRMQRPKK
jgi:hypothetical protein